MAIFQLPYVSSVSTLGSILVDSQCFTSAQYFLSELTETKFDIQMKISSAYYSATSRFFITVT